MKPVTSGNVTLVNAHPALLGITSLNGDKPVVGRVPSTQPLIGKDPPNPRIAKVSLKARAKVKFNELNVLKMDKLFEIKFANKIFE